MFRWFRRKKKYEYFVSYHFKKGNGTGYGNIEIITNHGSVSNFKDIEKISDVIKKKGDLENVIIINIIRIS